MLFGLGAPNLLLQGPTIAGGAWETAAPVTNVNTWPLAETAVSVNDDAASTVITCHWSDAVSARVLVLAGHNLSAAATVRWKRGSTDGGTDTADSGTVNAWRFTPRVYDGGQFNVIVLLPTTGAALWDRIEITDTSNPAGKVSIGRVAIAPVFEPARGVIHTLKDSVEDLSTVTTAESGADWPTERRRKRGATFSFPVLTQAEADAAHDIDLVEGTTAEVVWLPYMDDPARMQRFGGLARMRELSGIEFPHYRTRGKGYSVTLRV